MEQQPIITEKLTDTAKALVADNKGLLAIDESIGTCDNVLQHWAYRIFFGIVKTFDKLRESQLKAKIS